MGRGGGGLRGHGGVGRGGGGISESVQQSPSTKTFTVPRRTSGEPFHREKVVDARYPLMELSIVLSRDFVVLNQYE